jgi:hypothetical protein
LIVLLIMAVALTIGLAVTSRTVTDIEISEQTEEASRAFSAAEAGIEEALITASDVAPSGNFEEGAVTYVTHKDLLGTGSQYLFPESKGEVRTLWLAEYPETPSYFESSVTIFWGNADSTETPALEATIYYETGGSYKVIRYALDPNFSSHEPDPNRFCQPNGTDCEGVTDESGNLGFDDIGNYSIDGKTVKYKATLDLSPASGGTLLFARLRLLYTDEFDQVLGAQAAGTSSFASQGVKISSVGTAGGSTRKIEVVRLHPVPPGIFEFLLYSGTDLVK